MERLSRLSNILQSWGNQDRSNTPRKFQTALYLAQQKTNYHWYSYDLRRGKVVSNELDQELSQLNAMGVVASSCSIDGHSQLALNIEGKPNELTEEEQQLWQQFEAFMGFQPDVLEAAATLIYFWKNRKSDPKEKLNWIQRLGREALSQAEAIARES